METIRNIIQVCSLNPEVRYEIPSDKTLVRIDIKGPRSTFELVDQHGNATPFKFAVDFYKTL